MSTFRKCLLLLAAAAALWGCLLAFAPQAGQNALFFCSGEDRIFFDFFNARTVASMEHPYVDVGRHPIIGAVQRQDQCYPALAVRFVGLFPDSTSGAAVCQTLGTLLFMFGLVLFLRKYRIPPTLPAAALAVSAPFLFAAEVGNLILHAVGASLVFLAWYDSPSRWRRFCAAWALAVAAVLKIAPALLGLLYLATPGRRNLRGAFLAGGAFAVLLLVPFAFFGGGTSFCAWLANARLNSEIYATWNAFGPYGLVAGLAAIVGYKAEVLSAVHTPLRFFSSAFAVVLLIRAFARNTDDFSRVCLVSLGMLFLPATMMCYTVLYVVPLFIVGTARYTGPCARAFAWCWIATCLPLQIPLLMGSATACFAAAAMLDLCRILLRGRTPAEHEGTPDQALSQEALGGALSRHS